MGRILSIDFGEKRCGIAKTDELQIAVHPLLVVERKNLLDYLKKYLTEEDVEKIVFGKPQHTDGTPTHVWTLIEAFSTKLKNLFPLIQIDYQDESFTSLQAKEIMLINGMKKKDRRKKENVDLISAILILQRYLKHI